MSAPCQAACSPWADTARGCATIDDEIVADALAAASDLLFILSGRQFPGSCETTINLCTGCSGSCGDCYRGRTKIKLPEYPVTSLVSVSIDGVAFNLDSARIDDYRYLVRTDGEAWGSGNLLDADFTVAFTYGVAPPAAGVLAAEVLAGELAKACAGQDCKLPERVSSVTRQGITAIALDPFNFFTDGKVGLYEVDAFLSAYNPSRIQARSRIYSGDTPRHARITSP